nr:uncharacterized protein LOC104094606 [Nicotiana tomentosiformis]
MKKNLKEANRLWPEILPGVLWAYKTTPKTSIGETLYYLVYGTEAVISVEVREPNLRYSHESSTSNDGSRRQEIVEIDERRDMVYIRKVTQKQKVECYYNKGKGQAAQSRGLRTQSHNPSKQRSTRRQTGNE